MSCLTAHTPIRFQDVKGKPVFYTDEILEEICTMLEEGKLLIEICEMDNMPRWSTVHNWMDRMDAVQIRINQAREKGYDAIAENLGRFALNELKSKTTKTTYKDGKEIVEVTEYNDSSSKKLHIDVVARLLTKWNRKKYGDSILGEDNNLNVTVKNIPTKPE